MDCEFCGHKVENVDDNEFVCSKCGASYLLRYQGCYPNDDGGEEFFGEGQEPDWWLEKFNSNSNTNELERKSNHLVSDETIKEVERVSLCDDEELQYLLSKYRTNNIHLKEIKDKIDNRLKDCKNKFEDLI